MAEYMPILDTTTGAEADSSAKKSKEKTYRKKKKKALKVGGRAGLAGTELADVSPKSQAEKSSANDFSKMLAEMGLKKELGSAPNGETDSSYKKTVKDKLRTSGEVAAIHGMSTAPEAAIDSANSVVSVKDVRAEAAQDTPDNVISIEKARRPRLSNRETVVFDADSVSSLPRTTTNNEVVVQLHPKKLKQTNELQDNSPQVAPVIPIRNPSTAESAASTAAQQDEELTRNVSEAGLNPVSVPLTEQLPPYESEQSDTTDSIAPGNESFTGPSEMLTSAAADETFVASPANMPHAQTTRGASSNAAVAPGTFGGFVAAEGSSRPGFGSGGTGGSGGSGGPGRGASAMRNPFWPSNPNALASVPSAVAANQVAQAFHDGRAKGLLTGLLIGGGVEHIRHKRREKRQRKQADRLQKAYDRDMQNAQFERRNLEQKHDALRSTTEDMRNQLNAQVFERGQAAKDAPHAATERVQNATAVGLSTVESNSSPAPLPRVEAPDKPSTHMNLTYVASQPRMRSMNGLPQEAAALSPVSANLAGNALPIANSAEQYKSAVMAAERQRLAVAQAEADVRIGTEPLQPPEGHRLERSAWHTVEVDAHTGNVVEDPSIEYGQEYYRERSHELDTTQSDGTISGVPKKTANPGDVALAALAASKLMRGSAVSGGMNSQAGTTNTQLGTIASGVSNTVSQSAAGASTDSASSTQSQQAEPPATPGAAYSPATAASTIGWGVVLVVLIIVIIILT